MDSIQLSYPSYYLFFIAVIAALYALSLYLNEKQLKETKKWLPSALGTARFLAILALLFLLLAPLIRQILTEKEKPVVVMLKDISRSIAETTSSDRMDSIHTRLELLRKESGSEFDWDSYSFGQRILADSTDSLNTLSSNLATPLEYVAELYEDRNLGAIILLSDGIYNEGKNPLYAEVDLTVPIHTIAVGDTSQQRDILIKNIIHNRIVYLNDKFLVEADIQAFNANGSNTQLRLYRSGPGGNELIDTRNVQVKDDKFFESYSFEIEAKSLGNVKYFLTMSDIGNELSTENNSRNIYIEVLDARQKILLLSNSTHPDIKVLKKIITRNKNYEIETATADAFNRNPGEYDIVILHNLPSARYPVAQVLSQVRSDKIPVFFIAGNSTDRSLLNEANNVLTITGENFSLNNVTPVLNPDFAVFTYSEELSQRIGSFVPLKAPFGDYKANPSSYIFLTQKIGSVETPYPMLGYNDQNGHKQAVLCGEGIWKWNLMEFFESEDIPVTSELMFKTIQYISQKEDKRQFRAFTNRKNYQENEAVLFDAQLYNDNYELINSPEVSLAITNENNERFDYIFSKSSNYYIINAGRFPEGSYAYLAKTSYNGKELESRGSFTVQSVMKENYDLTARHDILAGLSKNTGGRMFYPENIDEIDSLLRNDTNIKTILYQKASTHSILDWPWLLFIIIFLLSLEWFGRRYFGAY